ncbi:MAG: hypothetical protein M1820_001664 [Bogoriella megaspora]|nr:MAG: hypothetical protein M1820_001664 [Bogoriella megaspora]
MPSNKGTNAQSLYYIYNGPSQVVKQTAIGVGAQNAILPIAPPLPNSSWTLTFNAPSLKCNPLSSVDSLAMQQNIASFITRGGNCEQAATFLAWFPRYIVSSDGWGHVKNYSQPYVPNEYGNYTAFSNNTAFLDPQSAFNIGMATGGQPHDAIMYIAVLPNMTDIRDFSLTSTPHACDLSGWDEVDQFKSPGTPENPLGDVGGNITMLQCQMYNSTYQTNFSYVNEAQIVSIQLSDQDNDKAVPIVNTVRGPGIEGLGAGNCSTLNEGGSPSDGADLGKDCDFDSSLLFQLSYQATLQAFANLLTGNITLSAEESGKNGLLDTTMVRSTSFVDTKELYYLTDYTLHAVSDPFAPDLQFALQNSTASDASGMARLPQNLPSQSLQDAIETMFKNFTVSLMSSPNLRPNYSSPNAPDKVNVTQSLAQTVYVYSAGKLWLAYGIATAVTLASVLIGLLVMFTNGATYSNNFSTILRVARATGLDAYIFQADMDDRTPAPRPLTNTSVLLSRETGVGEDKAIPKIEESQLTTKGPTTHTTLL